MRLIEITKKIKIKLSKDFENLESRFKIIRVVFNPKKSKYMALGSERTS